MTDRTVVYHCAPSVVWVQDHEGIRLVDTATARSWALHGTDAIAWDLLASGYELPQISQLLALLLSTSQREATALVLGMLRNWETRNLVESSVGEGDDQPSG